MIDARIGTQTDALPYKNDRCLAKQQAKQQAKQMLELVGDLALPVFAFYLLVASNFLAQVFGCRLQNVLGTSMIAKHAVGFLLLLFLIVIVNPENADREMVKNIGIAAVIYTWFYLTTRSPVEVMFAVLVLLLAAYLSGLSRQRAEKEGKVEEARSARLRQNIFAGMALGASLFGFGIYTVEKRREYQKAFSWTKFFSGTTACRNYTPHAARVL